MRSRVNTDIDIRWKRFPMETARCSSDPVVRSTVPVLVLWSLLSSSGERKSGQGGGSSAWLTSRQRWYYAGANSARLAATFHPPSTTPDNSSVRPPYTANDATYTVTHPWNALSTPRCPANHRASDSGLMTEINTLNIHYLGILVFWMEIRYFVNVCVRVIAELFEEEKKMTYSYIVGTIGTIEKDNVFCIIRHVQIYVTHKNTHVKMRMIYIQFLFETFSRRNSLRVIWLRVTKLSLSITHKRLASIEASLNVKKHDQKFVLRTDP